MLRYQYIQLICLAVLFSCITSISHSPITYNNKWFTGMNSFPTQNYFGNQNLAVEMSYTYTITLAHSMNDTIYRVGLGIKKQNTFIQNGDYFLYFQLSSPLSMTSFPIILSSVHMNLVQIYTFSYITVVSSWGDISFNVLSTQFSANISSSNSYTGTIASKSTNLNTTSPVQTFCIFTGFAITGPSNNQLSLIISAYRTSSTIITFYLTSKSETNIKVKYISFTQFSFNIAEISAIPGQIVLGTFKATNGQIIFNDPAAILQQQNTLYGLSGFHIINEGFINWQGTLTPQTSITITSTNSYIYYQFSFLTFKSVVCQSTTPYYLLSNKLCYDTCPSGSKGDSNLYVCLQEQSSSINIVLILQIVIPIGFTILIIITVCCIYRKCKKQEQSNTKNGNQQIKVSDITQGDGNNHQELQFYLKGIDDMHLYGTESKIQDLTLNTVQNEANHCNINPPEYFQIQIKIATCKDVGTDTIDLTTGTQQKR